MAPYRRILQLLGLILMIGIGCTNDDSLNIRALGDDGGAHAVYEISMRQELINDAPIGPGIPQPSSHCPTEPGRWISGSGRSTAMSNVFGDLTEVEVYCINVDRAELSGGLATWTDRDGDTISMIFSAKLLQGFVYVESPNASMIGFAQFTGGTGKWADLTGAAFLSGRQNGDGTATLYYQGTIYLPQ